MPSRRATISALSASTVAPKNIVKASEMQSAALHPHPFVIVRDQPRQDNIQSPPRGEEEIGARMIDDAFRDSSGVATLLWKTTSQFAAADAEHRPIQMDQESQIGEGPERPPIGVGSVAARENVETQRRRHQDDGGPDREDHDIVGRCGRRPVPAAANRATPSARRRHGRATISKRNSTPTNKNLARAMVGLSGICTTSLLDPLLAHPTH